MAVNGSVSFSSLSSFESKVESEIVKCAAEREASNERKGSPRIRTCVDMNFRWLPGKDGDESTTPKTVWLDEHVGVSEHAMSATLVEVDTSRRAPGEGPPPPKTGPLWEELSDHQKLLVVHQRMKQGLVITCDHAVAKGGTGRAIVPAANPESVLNPPCCAHTLPMEDELLEGNLPVQTLDLLAMKDDLREFYDQGLIGALARGIVVGYLGERDGVTVNENLPSVHTPEGKAAVEKLVQKDLAGLPDPKGRQVPNIEFLGNSEEEARAELHQRFPNIITGEWLHVHSIGVVLPKEGYNTKPRVVDDMSYRDLGVNAQVFHVALPSLRMVTLDGIVRSYRQLRKKNPGVQIKVLLADVKSYFKNMCLAFEDFPLATFKVSDEAGNDSYYVRTKCGFGARVYPAMSSRISGALIHCLVVKDGIMNVHMFIDDIIVLAADKGGELAEIERKVLARLARWNLPLSIEKLMPWATVRRVLGVLYDFNIDNPTQAIPVDRQERLLSMLRKLKVGKMVGVKAITSLYHSLLSVRRIAVQGQHYLSEMSRLHSTARRTMAPVRATGDLVLEADWWIDVLLDNQGVPLSTSLDEPERVLEDVGLRGSGGCAGATDASGIGVGGVFAKEYFSFDWNQKELREIGNLSTASATAEVKAHKITIACLEFHALLLGLAIWGPSHWKGRHVDLRCDNKLVVHCITTGKVKSSVVLARYLRLWHDLLHEYRVTASVTYISTHDNTLPDMLSRGAQEEFQVLTRGTFTRVFPPQGFRDLLHAISKPSSLRAATLIRRRRAGRASRSTSNS